MGQVTNSLLLERGLRTEFLKAHNNGEDPSDVAPVTMKTKSNNTDEKYGWLGEAVELREWIDERQLSGLFDFSYTLPNKSYEGTLRLDRDHLEDDQLGATMIRVRDLARKARIHVAKLFYEATIDGTTDLCYDGQAFFSNSHSEGNSGTQDNLLAGTGTSVAQIKTDFIAARAVMRKFKDDQAAPRNEGQLDLHIYAPVELEGAMEELFNALEISSTTNTLKGAAKPHFSSRLSADDANDWYLYDASGSIKPYIQQERRPIEFNFLGKGTEAEFMRKKILAGVDYRIGFGYGAWYKAIKMVNS